MQIESKFRVSAQLSVEGPLRMKEEYVEMVLESPTIVEETVPEQLKVALNQAVTTAQQLPVPIRDAVVSGLRLPIGKQFDVFFSFSSSLSETSWPSILRINFIRRLVYSL